MKKVIAALLVFALSYSAVIVYQQQIMKSSMSPIHLNFLAYVVASVILVLGIGLFSKKDLTGHSAPGIKYGVLTGFTASVVGDIAAMAGLRFSSSMNWGLLSRLSLPVTFLLAVVFLHEKATKHKLAAVLVALLGVFLVVYRWGSVVVLNRGDLFFFVAVLGFSIGNILSKKAMNYVSSLQLSLYRIISAAIMLSFFVFFFYPIESSINWVAVVIVGLSFVLGIVLVNYIIKKAGVSFFAVGATLVPVFVMIFSVLFMHEQPRAMQLLGGVLIISSILLFEKKSFLKLIKKEAFHDPSSV